MALPTINDYEEQREHRLERSLAIDATAEFPEPLAKLMTVESLEIKARSRIRGYNETLDNLRNLDRNTGRDGNRITVVQLYSSTAT